MLGATVIPDWYTSLDQHAYFYALSIMEAASAAFPKSKHKKMQEYISDQAFGLIIHRRRLASSGRSMDIVTSRIIKDIAYAIERPTRSVPSKCIDHHYIGLMRLAIEAQQAHISNDYNGRNPRGTRVVQ
eukprot:6890804-Pyramimonas_sp.AAC.1